MDGSRWIYTIHMVDERENQRLPSVLEPRCLICFFANLHYVRDHVDWPDY